MGVLALSGWGQPHDALAAVVPGALHLDYAHHGVEETLAMIAREDKRHEIAVGWSLGGQLLARAVAAGLIRPRKLVLIAAPFQFVKDGTHSIGMPRDTYDQFRSNYASSPKRTLQKAWELIAHGDKYAEKIRICLKDPHKELARDWLKWLDRLDGYSCRDLDFSRFPSTLIIHGDRDAVVWHEQARYFAGAIPGARMETWKDCGHAPHWHDTEKMKRLIHV